MFVGIAALFSGYHILLGVFTLDQPAHSSPVIVAMALYAAATIIAVHPAIHRGI